MREIIVALSGASGVRYAIRLIQMLVEKDCRVHLTISAPAVLVLKQEMGVAVDLQNFTEESLLGRATSRIASVVSPHVQPNQPFRRGVSRSPNTSPANAIRRAVSVRSTVGRRKCSLSRSAGRSFRGGSHT